MRPCEVEKLQKIDRTRKLRLYNIKYIRMNIDDIDKEDSRILKKNRFSHKTITNQKYTSVFLHHINNVNLA